MITISRAIAMTLSAGLFAALLVSNANAGCGDLSNLTGPFAFAKSSALIRPAGLSADVETASARGSSGASIVGMWNIQFVSQGNTGHNPSIPDGAIIDFGFNQWHSDGTEILNSGGHAANTGNFCLGVWGQTGFLTFEVNHFALSYDATSGALLNVVNIRDQATLSPSGDSFSGTFTIDVYDTKGNRVDHVGGTINATRVTVDTGVTAVP